MKRKLLGVVLLLLAVLALFLYFMPQGRALTGRLFGWTQSASDLALTNQVKSAFTLSKRLSAYAIEAKTKDGTVTLTGQVPTETDRDLAGNVVKDVPGVKNVENQLQVQPGLKPSEASVREGMRVTDLEIRADLNEKLVASQGLQGQKIQVAVQDRIVTLTGQVDTPSQKTGAEQLASSVANVAQVVNNLNINNPGAAQNETPGAPEGASKDKELTNRVLFALFKERENFADLGLIKAASREGTVALTGNVPSRAEKALAERIVRDVDGVKVVSNQLTVAPPK